MLALTALPVLLRLALLARAPAPTPAGSDDFSYWLLADTLRHFRLANPSHPMRQFFKTVFVLQQPSYSSIFPLGQGLAMAAGWLVFGHPWAGVLLSVAALCALTYWMLRAWTTAPTTNSASLGLVTNIRTRPPVRLTTLRAATEAEDPTTV